MSERPVPRSVRRWLRVALALVAAAVLLAVALYRPGGRGGFTTPAACLDAYEAARKDGDAEGYLRCLAAPLRAQVRQRFPDPAQLSGALRADAEGVKHWVQPSAPAVQGNMAEADADEVRSDGVRRLHFRLECSGGGWLVAGVDAPRARAAAIPYGTHVKDTPDEPEPPPPPE
jgi:hypothetical protein